MQLNKELNKENIDINKFTEYSQSSIKLILDKAIKKHNQIILTGAPGTGKTYNVRSYVNDQIKLNKDRSEFVQFHPSYDYSDFIEGLRPVVLDEATIEEPTFVKMDGIFKAFCRKVVTENYDKIKTKNPTEVNLPFSELYKKYEDDCTDKYFFIIDEINRADLSKVFGELMFGLEKSYRGIENSFQTQYKNLKTYEITNGKGKIIDFDCFSDGFFIPKNLYIIGTMNDIDRSVESFDFALRRRFKWIEIKANEVAHTSLTEILKNSSPEQINTLVDKIKKMNNVISVKGRELGLSEAYHIGHAYFKKVDLNNPLSLKHIFNRSIVPILKEYTRGRQQSVINDFIAECAKALEVEYEEIEWIIIKNKLINLYENTYKDKVYEKELNKQNKTIDKWKEYRQQIKDGTITLKEYTNRKKLEHYLNHFLEWGSNIFGLSRPGNAFQYMIKMNDNGTFYLNKYDNEEEQKEADSETANIYFEEKIKPLLKKIVNCNSFKELYDLEKDDLYEKFVAKQIIKKMICLESKVKECEYKYRIAQIYKDEAIEKGLDLFKIENEGMSQIKQNINIMEKAFEILSLDINKITEKQSFEVSKTLSKILFANENYIFEIISDALKDYNQIVLTGAPGTGKTYNVRSYVNDRIKTNNDRSEFVQFHPSYDYSDFIEGLRPAIIFNAANDKPTFVKQDGIFKAFCRKVIMNNFKELGDTLPVTFEDFEKKYSDAEENNKFKTKYFFIIDEINRADLSKVFGELMFGLEESYRGIKNSFQTQYKNLRTYQIESDGKAHLLSFDCFEGGFFIPKNLYIIGTMNDIDKSVDVFDFALRRRFQWIEVNAKKICKQSLINMLNIDKEKAKKLAKRICAMNDVISNEGAKFGLSEAYHIGHAYFKEYKSSTLQEIFNNDIALIIKEYTRGRNSEEVDKLIYECAKALDVSYEK